ncbi:MAG: zinc-binding dehydrogenase [Vicinamibacteria bacterium]
MRLLTRSLRLHRFAPSFREAARIDEDELRAPGAGELLVRNRFAGVNGFFDTCVCRNELPYRTLTPPLDLGVEAVGEVVAVGPGVPGLRPGDCVSTTRFGGGYREHQLVAAADAWPVAAASAEIAAIRPTGVSALVALEQVAQLRPGETIAISAAAGGLGQFLVQIARRLGARVIAICGGPEKQAFVRELGCELALDHRARPLREALAEACPRGIDVGFDSVGGDVLECLLDALAPRGRLVVAGRAASLGQPAPSRPDVVERLYWKAASIRAFQNALYPEYAAEASRRLLAWHAAGELRVRIDPVRFRGLAQAADAVEHLLSGRSCGKVVLEL